MSEKTEMYDKKKVKAIRTIIRAGIIPFDEKSETLSKILDYYDLTEKELDFICAFQRKSQNSEQLARKFRKWEEGEMEKIANILAKKGFIFNQPSSAGTMVYRLLPIIVIGTFEYTFMQGAPEDPEEKKRLTELAQLYDNLMGELVGTVQGNYEGLVEGFKMQPPTDRTVPYYKTQDGQTIEINEEIGAEEHILPAQTVEGIINKFDDIAVGACFCREYRTALGEPCEIDGVMDIQPCMTFGKSARHVVQQGFARKVSKDEALDILKKTEELGLIHKAFHNGSDITKEENSICNCCTDCCDTFNLWRMGAAPMVNSTNYLSKVNENFTGCGICIDKCPADAIKMNGSDVAEVIDERCIGCGLCARACPEFAISLNEGLRTVYLPPVKQ